MAAVARWRCFSHGRVPAGLAVALLVALAAGPAVGQTRGTWNVDADGLWSLNTNWLGNQIAGGISGTANFTNDITATRTVTLDTNRTIGAFVFGDADTATAASWIVTGSTMTMNNGVNSATLTVNALGTGATATISTVLGASGTTPSIIKDGVGTLVLGATNSFTTKLEIVEGTLQVSADRNLGGTGSFATDRIVISDGATLRTSAAFTMNAARGITIGSGGGTLDLNGGALTYAGRFTGEGQTLTTAGASGLTLQNTTGTPSDVNWNFTGGATRIFFNSTDALGTGSVQVQNNVRLVSQAAAIGTVGNEITLASGGGLSARTGAATFDNVVFPSTGSVVFNKDDQTTFGLTISSNATLDGSLTVDTSPGGSNAVGDVTLSGIFSGASGGLIKSGTGASGRLILAGANTYGGDTRINTGTLQLGDGGTSGSLSTSSVITGSAGGTLAFNRSDTITSGVDFNSAIVGGINIAQVGSGTLVLTASNTIGKTSITNGTLEISNANQLGAAPGTFTADQLTISNGATLRTTTAPLTLPAARGITIGSGGATLDVNASGNLIVNGRFTGSGETVTVTGSGGFSLGNTANGASDVNWDFAMNANQRAFFTGSDALGTGDVLVRNGIRLVSQTQAPTDGQVTNAVTLESGAGLSARDSAGAVEYTNVTLPSSGSLIFNRDDQATAALTIASGKELDGILTIDTSQQAANAVGDVTLSGVFSGASGGITKIGTGASGRLILGGVNTYGGSTTISTGTLALGATASIDSSDIISVASGATFDVSELTAGFTLGSGQTLSGAGTVLGDFLFANGSALNVTIGSPISASGGTVTFGNAFGIANLTGIDWSSLALDTPYTVLSTSQSFGESDILNFGEDNKVLVTGDRYAFFETGSLNVVVTAVPEPTTIVAAMIGLGGLGLAAARRRRSHDRG